METMNWWTEYRSHSPAMIYQYVSNSLAYSRTSELVYRTCNEDDCTSVPDCTAIRGKTEIMWNWIWRKKTISIQEFHDYIKIYVVKLYCHPLVQRSDYLSVTCTAPVSFTHFLAHCSMSNCFNTNGFHPQIPLVSLHRRWWRWNGEFTTFDTWQWADDLIMVVWLCRACLSSRGNRQVDSKS